MLVKDVVLVMILPVKLMFQLKVFAGLRLAGAAFR